MVPAVGATGIISCGSAAFLRNVTDISRKHIEKEFEGFELETFISLRNVNGISRKHIEKGSEMFRIKKVQLGILTFCLPLHPHAITSS